VSYACRMRRSPPVLIDLPASAAGMSSGMTDRVRSGRAVRSGLRVVLSVLVERLGIRSVSLVMRRSGVRLPEAAPSNPPVRPTSNFTCRPGRGARSPFRRSHLVRKSLDLGVMKRGRPCRGRLRTDFGTSVEGSVRLRMHFHTEVPRVRSCHQHRRAHDREPLAAGGSSLFQRCSGRS
jgi:hypothetical protein